MMVKKLFLMLLSLMTIGAFAQNFEKEQLDDIAFDKVNVKVGGDFALQLQMLDHSIEGVSADSLVDMKDNFNLPTANLTVTTDLAQGVQLYMNVFLSSRHHNEAWVEGGYLTIDKLPFLPISDELMKYFTIKAGVFTPDYGDAHYYRSTNGNVINNPFVGNWIMDAYTTNPGMEIMFRKNGIIAMVGTNNGRMNYGRGNDIADDLAYDFKVGYDKQLNEDLRVRGTFSGYIVPDGHSGSYLWSADRAGARYYDVMLWHDQSLQSDANAKTGRWDPSSGQTKTSSMMCNLFVDYKGLEIFGLYENMIGIRKGANQHFTQGAIQGKYTYKGLFVGTRYNVVTDNQGSFVDRLNIGGGYFLTANTILKLDYVTQHYRGVAHGNIDGGKFQGFVFEAGISF